MDVVTGRGTAGDRARVRAARTAAPPRPAQARPRGDLVVPAGFGLLAAVALLAFYLAVITVAQDWAHARQQLAEDRWFVAAVAAGFGTQVGLFNHLRRLRVRAARAGVAASTGTSTAAMLACCAHHLTEVLPIVGLSGAAIFLDAYKTPLLWLGIAMNLAGAAYLVRQVRRHARAGVRQTCRVGHAPRQTGGRMEPGR